MSAYDRCEGLGDRRRGGHVGRHRCRVIGVAELRGHGLGRGDVPVDDSDRRPLGPQAVGDGAADAGAGACHQSDLPGQGSERGPTPQLRLLERPVLDGERLGLGHGGVGGHRLGAGHDVDRVEVELAGDARGIGGGAEAEHADSGHEEDLGVGAAQGGGVGPGVTPVVRLVIRSVLIVQSFETRAPLGSWGGRLVVLGVTGYSWRVEKERADLRPQEMVGAGRAEVGQARRLGAAQEVEDSVVVEPVTDDSLVCARQPPQEWRQRRGLRFPLCPAEPREAVARAPQGLRAAVRREERLGRGDQFQGGALALL